MAMVSSGSASAKFILCGEHFVMSGSPGIVIPATNLRTHISLSSTDSPGVQVECAFRIDQPVSDTTPYEKTAASLIGEAAYLLDIDLTESGIEASIKTTIPPGQGAGSSSSLCQAIMQAMLQHFLASHEIHPNYLMYFGRQLEQRFHPISGIDNSAIAYRCPIFFEGGACYRIPLGTEFYFVVGSTGARTGTSPYEIMHRCRTEHNLCHRLYVEAEREMPELARQMFGHLKEGSVSKTGKLMNRAHAILNGLGLSTPDIEAAIEKALELGAYGAKLTGAGAGGFVIALVPFQSIERIQKAWIQLGLTNVSFIQIH